mgnify:CR=1 FL=1
MAFSGLRQHYVLEQCSILVVVPVQEQIFFTIILSVFWLSGSLCLIDITSGCMTHSAINIQPVVFLERQPIHGKILYHFPRHHNGFISKGRTILHATLDPFLTESFCFDWSGARGRRFTGFRVWSQTVWEFIEIHQELFVKTNCHTELFLIISQPTSPHVCFIVLRQKIITPLNSRNNREYRRRRRRPNTVIFVGARQLALVVHLMTSTYVPLTPILESWRFSNHLGRLWGLKVLGNFDAFLDLFDHLMQFRGSVERV